MAWSRDYALSQTVAPHVPWLCRTLASLHTTHLTYCAPYDDPASYGAKPGWQALWLHSIRATGNHVWWRGGWNNWQGWFGQPTLTASTSPAIPLETGGRVRAVLTGSDQTSYLARTYAWIRQNAEAFEAGDVFSPMSEPQDAGILPYVSNPKTAQFPNLAAFNQFILDLQVVCQAAFVQSGKPGVVVGLWGIDSLPGDGDQLSRDALAVLTPPLSLDVYVPTPAAMVQELSAVHAYYHAPLVLGEWGDAWDHADPTTTSRRIDTMYHAVSQLPWITGVGYFEGIGHKDSPVTLIGPYGGPNALQVLPQAHTVGKWFARQTPRPGWVPWVWAGAGAVAGGGLTLAAVRHRQRRDKERRSS